jgi:hypothetical protein
MASLTKYGKLTEEILKLEKKYNKEKNKYQQNLILEKISLLKTQQRKLGRNIKVYQVSYLQADLNKVSIFFTDIDESTIREIMSAEYKAISLEIVQVPLGVPLKFKAK